MAENEIPLLGEEATTSETNDTTTFVSAGDVVDNSYYHNTIQQSIVKTITGDTPHSINDFLSRPVPISYGEWEPDHTYYWDVGTWFNHAHLARWREKLKGFYGLTATLNFKMVFNSQPFEQGSGMLSWCPLAAVDDNMWSELFKQQTTNALMSLTPMSCLPHVVFDVSQSSEVNFSVPHISPTCIISLLEHTPAVGILMFSTLAGPSSHLSVTKIPYTLYFYLTEVTTFGATSVQAQGDESEQAEADLTNVVSKVGSVARKVHTFASNLMDTPVLGDALKPFARPILAAGDSFLKIFGFSRPADIRMTNVSHQILGHTALCDAPSFASKMSVMHNQKVSPIAMGLTKEDELAISHLVKKKAIVDRVKFKVGDARGNVDRWWVNPNVYRYHRREGDSRVFYYPSPLRMVSELFAMWRGSIVFTFQIVCSNFHSGRLRFVYDTKMHTDEPQDIASTYSQIIDVRGPQTFSIVCPFLSVTPWRTVPNFQWPKFTETGDSLFFTETQLPQEGTASHAYGLDNEMVLSMLIETPFRAPESVSQDVDIIVWVSGGEDLEFAHPVTCQHPSVIGPISEIPVKAPAAMLGVPTIPPLPKIDEVEPQGYEDDGPVYSFGTTVSAATAYSSTVGEVVRSLRTLIKRPQLQGQQKHDLQNGFTDKVSIMIPPWNFGVNTHEYSNEHQDTPHTMMHGDALHKIFHAFQFYQGGMRIIVRPRDYYATGTIQTVSRSSNILTNISSSYAVMRDFLHILWEKKMPWGPGLSDATVFFSSIVGGATEVEVPFYSKFPFCTTSAEHTSFSTNMIKDVISGNHPDIFLVVNFDVSATGSSYEIYRSAADDFSLGYFLFPPLSLANHDYRSMDWDVMKSPVFPAAASASQNQAGAKPLSQQSKEGDLYYQEFQKRIKEMPDKLSPSVLATLREKISQNPKNLKN